MPRPMYQFGFEGEIYYLGENIRGDWFGPGRYSTLFSVLHDKALLSDRLKSLGVKSFLVNVHRPPFSNFNWESIVGDHFSIISKSNNAILFVVK